VDEQLIPVRQVPVDGTDFDLRAPKQVRGVSLDAAFADAGPGDLASLTAPDGSTLTLSGDEAFRYVQVYTHRSFATLPEGGVAVALEPMTAPADAFNSGLGLKRLEPGETWSVTWSVRYEPASGPVV
jgi:aldose 1-epimerase